MATTTIDARVLRESSFPDLAKEFKRLASKISNGAITDYLLAGLVQDSLPLRVLAVWIKGFADTPSIVKALRFEESAGVRRLAIKRFKRCLRQEAQMITLWDTVGGTKGLLQLFCELSVHDVQSFCQALGGTSTYNVAKDMRQGLLTEFTMALLSEHFPQAKFRNPEKRPFTKHYANIVPACTEEFVRLWEANEALPRAGGRWLDHAHFKHTRERCVRQLGAEKGKNFRFAYFKNAFHELPPSPATKHMSQSMAFSVEFLQYLGQHPELEISPGCINNDIVLPLLRRLARRRAPIDTQAQALKYAVQALEPRMKIGGTLDFSTNGPLRTAFNCWNRDRVAHEQLLIDILRLASETQRTISLEMMGMLLPRVRESYRYKLLSLMIAYLRPFSKDLEKDDDLKELGSWPTSIFAALPSEQSHDLLQRLIHLRPKQVWQGDIFVSLQPKHAAPLIKELARLRPSGNFLNWGPLGQQNEVFKISHNLETAILHLYVSPASEERDRGWKSVIDERKKEAARAREQTDRAMWARSAILCSIATNSLGFYEETLTWARRFNRDALTVKQLYARDTICTTAGITLLSGLPSDPKTAAVAVDMITESVAKGNKIMMLLLETAFQGIREPSFQFYDWHSVLGLFNEVVQSRLNKADKLQDSLALLDDQIYAILWQDTLDTVMYAEELCLKDDYEKLSAQNPKGILGRRTLPVIFSVRAAKCRFFDGLASRRDELWQKYRRTKDSNVVSLQSPWPKGLSFQDAKTLRFGMGCAGYAGTLSYLESRAKAIVYANPTVALLPFPTDKTVRKAIGGHSDDYEEALEFYVAAGDGLEERQRRKKLAWEHATGPLGQGRGLSATEAQLFWEERVQRPPVVWSRKDLKEPHRPDPTIPAVDDAEEPTEWNPDPNPQQWTLQSRDLECTCIDAILQRDKDVQEATGGLLLRKPEPATEKFSREAFWDVWRMMSSVPPAAREGLVAIGLMLINSKCCPNKRLFSRPFPTGEDVRFPALFLDEEFLDRDDISEDDGFVILERLARDAPLTLVAELCEAMLSNIEQGDSGRRDFEQETLRLLKILVESDRPNLALDLVRKVVIERPDASSWHRHMLTKGLFDRMKSQRAREFLWELVFSMKTKLQEQAQRKPAVEGEQAVSTPPMIKVTTVTALAQLLASATFVSGEETIDILTDVFSNARHPDIRVAIIQSLTSILQKTRHASVKAKILDALEEHAVPVASSMSERSPMSEQDWQRAESELEIPEVNDPQSKALQPVLNAIDDAYGSVKGETLSQIYSRILLPILQASAANNRRWMRIFLRKHNLHCDVAALPLVPAKPTFLAELVHEDVQYDQEGIFRVLGEATLTNLDPSTDVAEVNSAIANDATLRASNGGKHWLSLWSNPGIAALSFARSHLHQYLMTPAWAEMKPSPFNLIQQIVFRQLEVMIMRADERFTEQNHVLAQLARPLNKSEAYEKTWERNVRPLIERLVEKIQGLRTPQWQRDPNRFPVALRDTFDMRIWLLTWPGWTPALLERPDHDSKLETFANELCSELSHLADQARNGKPYHSRFTQLKDVALGVNPRDHCFLALYFGTHWEGLKLENYLGVEFAEYLLRGAARPSDEKLIRAAGEMFKSWTRSADETVRMAGLRTARIFEQRRNGGNKEVLGRKGDFD